jgi:hypothetical protein
MEQAEAKVRADALSADMKGLIDQKIGDQLPTAEIKEGVRPARNRRPIGPL